MGSPLFILTIFLLSFTVFPPRALSVPPYTEFITPIFTASNFQFIDHSGVFLVSRNGTFKAAIANPKPEKRTFYFCVIHATSGYVVWSANREQPISDSGQLRLTIDGLAVTDDTGRLVWSTSAAALDSPVAFLQLHESGNLVLLDRSNDSLWQSFEHPTDTILMGQTLSAGQPLAAALSDDDDLASGDYRFTVTGGDAMLQWNNLTYWKISMEPNAYRDSNSAVSYMSINGTGLYLFGENGSSLVIQMNLGKSDFRVAKLRSDGRFIVSSFAGDRWVDEFGGPNDDCRIPFFCGAIGLCSTGVCSCPPSFRNNPQTKGCEPADKSHILPSSSSPCNRTESNSSSISYIKLGRGMDYFANDFTDPVRHGVNLITCQQLCSRNCSCLAIFHSNSSGSCYLLQNYIGSIMSSSMSQSNRLGYVKSLVVPNSEDPIGDELDGRNFPIVGLVLLPSSGFFLLVVLVVMVVVWFRRKRPPRLQLGRTNSSSSAELEIASIPGLPVRFSYEDLVVATKNFSDQIGSGGFGVVYKGSLPDKTVVAIKKMTSLGVQGKKEFCAEIAIIGNIHHVNLVRLKGFCAQKKQWFLVYEYMNRGSLDRTLFGNGPALEWQERFDIALGTARGLAYLHAGCDHKIIHCDVKPENILLHDSVQVKISDFGLSKLLSPEQSSLFTTLRGTRGYLAPEWLTSSAISDKTDVYSYGMVLLEIVRGRKNCSFQRLSQSTENDSSSGNSRSSSSFGGVQRNYYFPLLALEMHEQRRYPELADPRLEGRVTSEEVERLVKVALCCVHEDPALRPTMVNVVGMLEGGIALGEPRVESLNFLRFYGRTFNEPSTVEGHNNEIVLPTEGLNTTTSGSHNSFSYMSSQQVSGPR